MTIALMTAVCAALALLVLTPDDTRHIVLRHARASRGPRRQRLASPRERRY